MDIFFIKLFKYIGARLTEPDLQTFVETIFVSSMFVNTFSPEEYQRLRTCYNTHVRPNCPIHMKTHAFPTWTIEERVSLLEEEHQNTRVIQSTFVDLLREHRESFDEQLSKVRAMLVKTI